VLVLDNIIFSLQSAGGISTYWGEIIKRLMIREENVIYFEKRNKNIVRKRLNIRPVEESFIPIPILRYLPFLWCPRKKFLFHSSYYRVSLNRYAKNIVTVHDFTYEHFSKGIKRFIHHFQKKIAINKAAKIICVSNNTLNDLLFFFPGVDKKKVVVIHNGVNDVFKKNEYRDLPVVCRDLCGRKYILFVGERRGYKNFEIAIKVVERLSEYILVCIGSKDLSMKEKRIVSKIDDRFFLFKSLSSEDLCSLYQNAFVLLYPSSYEGFGIPVVESMMAGCPVVAVNKSSIPEIAGDAALLVNEITVDAFCQEIKKLEDPIFRRELVRKGKKNANRFSWDICFEKTYAVYKELLRDI